MKATRTWILIADGARARIFQNAGPGRGLTPAVDDDFDTDLPPTREVMADRPGTAVPGSGPRHGYAPRVDWHQFEKRRFAASMADVLNAAARRRAFDRLVLVAPPEPLGALRAKLEPLARQRVVREIGKDLTGVDDRDLPSRLESDGLVL